MLKTLISCLTTIKIIYIERIFPEMVLQIDPKVMIYNQDTIYTLEL